VRVPWRFPAIFAFVMTIGASAEAETVPPTPAPTPEPVVAEQHPIQVGDVIMAPAIEKPNDQPRDRRRFPSTEEPRAQRRWYGTPILIADGLAYGGLALAINVEQTDQVALPLSIGTFLLAGPITHGAHGQWGRSGLSLAARAVLPLGGVILGATGCTADSDCADSLAGGAIAGMLAATIVDAAVLAYEPVAETATVQPMLSLARDQLWLGAGGTF